MVNLAFDRAAAQASRRAREAYGADVLRLRSDAGVTRSQLGRASGVDPSYLRRIEAGTAHASFETCARLAVALGADLATRLYPNTGPTIRDRHQARIAEALLRFAGPRWRRFVEIAVRRPSRGWIDIGLFDPHAHVLVATEIQSELRRLEQLIRWSAEKAASLPSWDGWSHLGSPPEVSSLLIVRDTRSNRAVARDFRRLLDTSYPGNAEDALSALTGVTTWPGSALLWARITEDDAEAIRFVARR